ncbi:sterol desaturase family protein [Megalodesulfovibrio paquesii]
MLSEPLIRLGSFALAALAFGLLEHRFPRRPTVPGRQRRWVGNLGVVAVSTVLVRLLVPLLPVALAAALRGRGWGLLPWLGLPEAAAAADLLLGFFLLDLAIYAQHVAFHRWRPLWRLHRMHHADTFIDFSTGVRFHPLEILLSVFWKLALVAVLGPSPASVLLFEVLLNVLAMFNHANLALPQSVDRWLRYVLVTPDMHRVHHSTDGREMNHNYGFNAPWWDRLFRTYKPAPDQGHLGMRIGLNIFRDARYQSLPHLLWLPFR